jgi:transcriptional regulator with XRE-family HTH domain
VTDSTSSLGAFLRALRERRQPADFGLPPGMRRRTPGLRREEAAQLCGISPTWLTWLEQGRADAASTPTLVAIATGLRLSTAERHYLFELAARSDPDPHPQTAADRQALQPLVDTISTPAYVLDRHWDALAWNAPAARLLADWLGTPQPGNLLRYVFLHPAARTLIIDWPQRCHRLVAEFRADCASRLDDPVNIALVEQLSAASADFRAVWAAQQVLEREGGRRAFALPEGLCTYRQFTLRPALDPELKLVMLING